MKIDELSRENDCDETIGHVLPGPVQDAEANVFAAELLMPEPTVRSIWKELGEVEQVAARFVVSPSAMCWRLYSFGLVT